MTLSEVENKGWCLDSNGANVYTLPCKDGNPYQAWKLAGDGTVRHVLGDGCLTDSDTRSIDVQACNGDPHQQWSQNAPVVDVAAAALAHINELRAQKNIAALTLDPALTGVAQKHSDIMAGGCGLSHKCDGETSFGDRFTAAGVKWGSAAENLASGTAGTSNEDKLKSLNGFADSFFAADEFDNSRKNMMNGDYSKIGIGITVAADGNAYITQDYVS